MPITMKLTQTSVAEIKAPPGAPEAFVWDDKLKGFGVRVRNGKRTYFVQLRVGLQQRRRRLGDVDSMPCARARAAADNEIASAKTGADLQARRKAEREDAKDTFAIVAQEYLKNKRDKLRPRSYKQVSTHLTKHFSTLARVPMKKIDRRDVARCLSEISSSRGLFAAKRARTSISTFLQWAFTEGIVDINVALGTASPTEEKPRDRVLSDSELVKVWRACRPDDHGRIVKFLLLTGCRRDEIGGLRKSELERLADRKIELPGSRMKSKRPFDTWLSDPALELVKEAINVSVMGRDAIFGRSDSTRGFSGWSRGKAMLDRRIVTMIGATLAPWRLHDIRRTVSTGLNEIGVAPHVAEAVLGHALGGVHGIYNRAQYWPERVAALKLWAIYIEALLSDNAVLVRALRPDADNPAALARRPKLIEALLEGDAAKVEEVLTGRPTLTAAVA